APPPTPQVLSRGVTENLRFADRFSYRADLEITRRRHVLVNADLTEEDIRNGKFRRDDLSVVELPRPLHSRLTISFIRANGDFSMDVKPVANDTVDFQPSNAQPMRYASIGGVKYTICLGDHTGRVDHRATAASPGPSDLILLHNLFDRDCSADWIRWYLGVTVEMFDKHFQPGQLATTVIQNTGSADAPSGALETDVTVRDDVILPNLRSGDGPVSASREVRYASDQGWQPRRIVQIRNHHRILAWDLVWGRLPAGGWFPTRVTATHYLQESKNGGTDVPGATYVYAIDLKNVSFGDTVRAPTEMEVLPSGFETTESLETGERAPVPGDIPPATSEQGDPRRSRIVIAVALAAAILLVMIEVCRRLFQRHRTTHGA
ncbi:MAG: hypothetical protein ACREJC_06060, partial [Tepidisphaeraceae bacterium]